MNPKRKPFIWISSFFAFLFFILSAIVFGVTLNNRLSKLRRLVLPIVSSWKFILWNLFALAIFSAVLALYTLWFVLRSRKKNRLAAAVVLLGHCVVLGAAIYIAHTLDQLHAAPSKSMPELFQLVSHLVKDGSKSRKNPQHVPEWLDNVQKNDEHCCGIRTYRDWETLWAPLEQMYPKSCCRHDRPNCTTSSQEIVYPDLVGLNIKTAGGCYSVIIDIVKTVILETKKFTCLFTVAIGLSLVAAATLYVIVFFFKKTPNGQDDEDDSDDDDDTVPKFSSDQVTWRSLEFYRILIKRKKKQNTGFVSTNPTLPITSSTFPTSPVLVDQSADQTQQIQYRVDVLSPSTVVLPNQATSSAAPPQSVQLITILDPTDAVDDVNSIGFTSSDPNAGQDPIPQPMQRKRHRHRRRRDFQENDVVLDNSGWPT